MLKTQPIEYVNKFIKKMGRKFKHRRTLKALGFKKHQQTVVHDDSPTIRGMLRQVHYLVQVHEVK